MQSTTPGIVNRSASIEPCYQIEFIPNFPYGELPDWLVEFWFYSEEEARLGVIVYTIMRGNMCSDAGEFVSKAEFVMAFTTAIKAVDVYCCRN